MALSYDEIEKVINGDLKAFENLLEEYDRYITKLCTSSSGRIDIDEKQELCISLYKAVRNFHFYK